MAVAARRAPPGRRPEPVRNRWRSLQEVEGRQAARAADALPQPKPATAARADGLGASTQQPAGDATGAE